MPRSPLSLWSRALIGGVLSIGLSAVVAAPCPTVMPKDEGWMKENYNRSAEAVFEHYIKPAMTVAQAGRYMINPGSAVAGLLIEIYEKQIELAKKDVVLLYLVQSIQINYQRFSTERLNTQGALALLGSDGRTEALAVLDGSALCVSGMSDSAVKFQVSFYGMRKKECELLTRRLKVGNLADEIRVNNSPEGVCAVDHRGASLRKFIWSNYGRNQVTFVFGRG